MILVTRKFFIFVLEICKDFDVKQGWTNNESIFYRNGSFHELESCRHANRHKGKWIMCMLFFIYSCNTSALPRAIFTARNIFMYNE